MSNGLLTKIIDPKFPNYVYAAKPLVPIYESSCGVKKTATLFLGEWMKVIEASIPDEGRVNVKYRGGQGYADAGDLTRSRHLEIFFIDVNQGDSILIQSPDDRRVLIDGGQKDEAHEFIRQKYNLGKAENYIDFEAVLATHSDNDHAEGLIKILKDPKIAVKRFYHNGLFRRKDKKNDPGPVKDGRITGLADRPSANDEPTLTPFMIRLIKAADEAGKRLPVVAAKMAEIERWQGRLALPEDGFVFKRLDAAEKFLPPYDGTNKYMTVEVLWPRAEAIQGQLSYPAYKDAGKTVNGNSIVLRIKCGPYRILLTGDLNQDSMDDLLKLYGQEISADVYKAAHHGSQDFSVPFLKTVKADAAVISSGDDRYDVHGHPRAVLLGTITKYSQSPTPAVFSTELAACFTPVSLTKAQQLRLNSGKFQVYERSIQGIVHLRCDGKKLYLGTVHGRKAPEDPQANALWKWDIWPDKG